VPLTSEIMDFRSFLAAALALVGFAVQIWGQAAVLNYQGRLFVDGQPFDGLGYFNFTILDSAGTVLWASRTSPAGEEKGLPPGVVRLQVTNGVYSVRLGDTNAGQPVLDGGKLRRAAQAALRIRFNDGIRGWKPASEDVPLGDLFPGTGEEKSINGADAASILRELRELRAIVARQQSATPPARKPAEPVVVTVPLGDGPSIGSFEAPLALMEFTDYQCSYCQRFQQTVLPGLLTNYVRTGKLRIISRNLPLAFHPNANPAANAAACAGDQQQYWPMREKLFAHMTNLTRGNFLKLAEELQLDTATFSHCLDERKHEPRILRDTEDAGAAGITGTPSFVLGKATGGNITGILIEGTRPLPQFETEIKKALAAAESNGAAVR
jgi:protein-disulfide isomerase